MIKYQLENNGFAMLTKMIVNGSPQLDGDDQYLIEFIRDLKFEDEEEVVDVYIKRRRKLDMEN